MADRGDEFVNSARSNNIDVVNDCLKSGVPINYKDKVGRRYKYKTTTWRISIVMSAVVAYPPCTLSETETSVFMTYTLAPIMRWGCGKGLG